jgi:hypothetical protein
MQCNWSRGTSFGEQSLPVGKIIKEMWRTELHFNLLISSGADCIVMRFIRILYLASLIRFQVLRSHAGRETERERERESRWARVGRKRSKQCFPVVTRKGQNRFLAAITCQLVAPCHATSAPRSSGTFDRHRCSSFNQQPFFLCSISTSQASVNRLFPKVQ